MRGKVDEKDDTRVPIGITPAHAGKSPGPPSLRGFKKDHPRACGEKLPLDPRQEADYGSPPRMRGKVYIAVHLFKQFRITPAHAGKSPRRPG